MEKPTLSAVGTSVKFIRAKDMGTANVTEFSVPDGALLTSVVDHSLELGRTDSVLTKYYKTFSDTEELSLNHLILKFVHAKDAEEFLMSCKTAVNVNICNQAKKETQSQSSCSLWFELRFVRETASKAYDVMHCQTIEVALVESWAQESSIVQPCRVVEHWRRTYCVNWKNKFNKNCFGTVSSSLRMSNFWCFARRNL